MSALNQNLIDPTPGAYLTVPQSQRAAAFQMVLQLVAGRSVGIDVIWAIARWIYNNEERS